MLKKLIIFLLLIPLLSLTGCQKKTSSLPTPEQSSLPAGWQTYTSPNHKLTLYYPPGWQVVPEIDEEELLTFSLSLDEDGNTYNVSVRAEPNPKNLSSLDWAVKQVITESQEEAKLRYTPVTLGPYQAVTESGPVVPESSGPMTAYLVAPQNGWAYEFTYTANAPQAHEKYLPTLHQIIKLMKID